MSKDSDKKQAIEPQAQALAKAERLLEERSQELRETRATLSHTIEELKDKKLVMVQQEKLASIGLLAAGIAHEINNPIGFVKSNLEVLKDYFNSIQLALKAYNSLLADLQQVQLEPPLADTVASLQELLETHDIDYITEDSFNSIQESLSGALRVQEIVSDLKDFSRNDDDQRVQCDLNACIEGSIKLVWNELKQKVDIDRQFGDLPLIYCCASQLTQVFINIIMNAFQAIGGEGTIEVRTAVDKQNIRVEFIDSGPGIEEANLVKLFDPFFTTKDVGMGTGLGLYVSHGLIQKHRGRIWAENEPGKGAKMIVTLPIDMRGDRSRKSA